jgi:hypothetical protein
LIVGAHNYLTTFKVFPNYRNEFLLPKTYYQPDPVDHGVSLRALGKSGDIFVEKRLAHVFFAGIN